MKANNEHEQQPSVGERLPACHRPRRVDYLLCVTGAIIVAFYVQRLLFPGLLAHVAPLDRFGEAIYTITNTIWWGFALGMVMIALLSKVPREFVIHALGGGGMRGLLRATLAGVALDLCSHGILMVGAKLYERGATTGQVIAFLVASPWNSLSMTLILIALIGFGWTVVFIAASVVVALIAGLAFEILERTSRLAPNPHIVDIPAEFRFFAEARRRLRATRFDRPFLGSMARAGITESRIVMRWGLLGIVLAATVRGVASDDLFQDYFGPGLLGLGLTLVAATVIEVCSEGSAPMAADLLGRAGAPGNSFAFLMTGVSTDYTEIMILKDTTGSWRVPLLLPLVTLPQIVVLAVVFNFFGS